MNRRHFIRNTAAFSCAVAAPIPLLGQGKRDKIRIGQIGTMHAHAEGKMRAVRGNPDYEVVGIVEPSAERRAAVEDRSAYKGLTWMTEEQLLGQKGLQAVVVETEVRDLLSTAARVAAAGHHIHLDKPAGESLPAFKKVLREVQRHKRTLQMGYMFRYNPAFRMLFQTLKDGWLGDVFSLHTVIGKVVGKGTRESLMPYKGGAMFELGCHVIDAVVHVLGRPQRVHAHPRSSSAFNDGLLDNQLAVLDYPNATATVRANVVEVGGFARRQFVVCGDKGVFDIRPIEPPKARMALSKARGKYTSGYQDLSFPNEPRYVGEFEDLARVIRGEKALEWTPEHDLAVQETVLLSSSRPLE